MTAIDAGARGARRDQDVPDGNVDVHALRGVTSSLTRGEFIVPVGPSGSGKSTLLNILGGLDAAGEEIVVHLIRCSA